MSLVKISFDLLKKIPCKVTATQLNLVEIEYLITNIPIKWTKYTDNWYIISFTGCQSVAKLEDSLSLNQNNKLIRSYENYYFKILDR